jgi:GTP-binding protein HflX
MMGDYWDHRPYPETAVLVGVINQGQSEELASDYLEELAFLTETAGAEIRAVYFTQRLNAPDPRTFIGSGKLGQVKEFVKEEEIDMVIFDDELSPSQLRTLSGSLNAGSWTAPT